MYLHEDPLPFKRRVSPIAALITIGAIVTGLYFVLFFNIEHTTGEIRIEQAAHQIVEGMQTADWQVDWSKIESSGKEYHLTDSETNAKWIKYLDSKIETLEIKSGEPKTILRRVCRENGLHGDECPKILYGMALQESIFGKAMIGDGGKSKGWFHIMYYHNIPDSCSHDLGCSADWTLKRMIRFGFGKNAEATKVSIMRHNGTPYTTLTMNYFKSVTKKSNLW